MDPSRVSARLLTLLVLLHGCNALLAADKTALQGFYAATQGAEWATNNGWTARGDPECIGVSDSP